MWRFVVQSTGIVSTLALLIGGALIIGRIQPSPKWMTALHVSDCQLPCWLGIIPGQTSGSETLARIDAVFATTLQEIVASTLEHGSGNGGIGLPLPAQSALKVHVG